MKNNIIDIVITNIVANLLYVIEYTDINNTIELNSKTLTPILIILIESKYLFKVFDNKDPPIAAEEIKTPIIPYSLGEKFNRFINIKGDSA